MLLNIFGYLSKIAYLHENVFTRFAANNSVLEIRKITKVQAGLRGLWKGFRRCLQMRFYPDDARRQLRCAMFMPQKTAGEAAVFD